MQLPGVIQALQEVAQMPFSARGQAIRACVENHAGLRAKRRSIKRIIASFSSVSLVWTLRSSSLLRRRCRPMHIKLKLSSRSGRIEQ